MADTLYPPVRPQSVGEVLDTVFRIFGATLPACLLYAALGVIAGQLPAVYDLLRGRTLVQAVFLQKVRDPIWWALYMVALVGTIMLTNAVLLRQRTLASGEPKSSSDELVKALRHVPGVVVIWISMALAIGLLMIPVGIVGGLFGQKMVVLLAGLVALIPASWLFVRWSCAVPVYLLTERGPLESMGHSLRLTGGNFWRLSVIYTVGLVLLLVLYVLSGVLGMLVAVVVGHGDVALITAAGAAVVILIGAVATPFYCAMGLAVLGDLTLRSEGGDLARRLSVPIPQ